MAYCLFGAKSLPEPILTLIRNKLQWNLDILNIFIDENLMNLKMAAILSQPQCVINEGIF